MERNQTEKQTREPVRRQRLPLSQRELSTELTEEFTLPDYQPEVRRLVGVTATVRPPARYIGGGEAELSGGVDYTVLYVGNDGTLAAAPLFAEYRFALALDPDPDMDATDAPGLVALVTAESVTARVTAPRKLTIKCRLRAQTRCEMTCLIGERYSGELPEGTELCRLTDTLESVSVYSGIEEGLTLTEEVIPDGTVDDLQILSAEGKVFLTSLEAGSGEVRCRGEVYLTLTVLHEPNGAETFSLLSEPVSAEKGTAPTAPPQLSTLTRKLPLEATIPVEGADVSCRATAWGTCTDLSVAVEEGRILCELGLALEAICQKREQTEYTKDLYVAGRDSSCTYRDRQIPIGICAGLGNLSAHGTATLSELGIRPGAQLLNVTGTASVAGVTVEKERAVLSGNVRFALMLADVSGEVSSAEALFPFRYMLEGERLTETTPELCCQAVAQLISSRARIDGDRLVVDGEIALSYSLTGERTVKMPELLRLGEIRRESSGELRLYYPAPGETLWEAAKRFCVPVTALTEQNELPTACRADAPESMGKTRFLLV